MPVLHPAWYLRNPKNRDQLIGDLMVVRRIVEGVEKIPVDMSDRPTVIEGQRQDIVHAIKEQGWAFFWSEILQDKIAVVDETVLGRKRKASKKKLPKAIAALPTYTTDELVKIGMLGKGKLMKVEDLRRIHMVKKVLEGVVVQ